MPREQEFPTARVQMTWNDFVGSHFQLTLQLPEDRPREDLVMASIRHVSYRLDVLAVFRTSTGRTEICYP
jgi:hypothetical protein